MENPQIRHYANIHESYKAHYYDAPSLAYRRKFIFEPLCAGIDLSGCRVADVASGSGYNSLILREMFPTIKLEGFDISESACADYARLIGTAAHQADLMLPFSVEEPFDAVIVVGGLHHCVINLSATLNNIASMLRPGGMFLLYEPSARFIGDFARRMWYRRDGYFEADTERALTPEELEHAAAALFEPVRTIYLGGPAYFLILQSLILRIPLSVKPKIMRASFLAERAWSHVQIPFLSPVFGAVWRRTGVPAR